LLAWFLFFFVHNYSSVSPFLFFFFSTPLPWLHGYGRIGTFSFGAVSFFEDYFFLRSRPSWRVLTFFPQMINEVFQPYGIT